MKPKRFPSLLLLVAIIATQPLLRDVILDIMFCLMMSIRHRIMIDDSKIGIIRGLTTYSTLAFVLWMIFINQLKKFREGQAEESPAVRNT